MSEYVIPKKSLHGKLVSFRAQGAWDANGAGGLDGEEGDSDDEAERRYEYRIIGLPMVLEGEAGRYQRNQYMWNVCFVFRASASLAAFEPVVRKTARILRSAEVGSATKMGADDSLIRDTCLRPSRTIRRFWRCWSRSSRISTRTLRHRFRWTGTTPWSSSSSPSTVSCHRMSLS